MAGEIKLPYMNAYGTITKVLTQIKTAATPDRFTQDFLATKLGLKGGSPKPVIPFLKRTGFIGSDGSPTELYKRYRNPGESKRAAAQALKTGFSDLYQMNEYAHELSDKDLQGLIVQATGLKAGSTTVKAIVGSFKALNDFAAFDDQEAPYEAEQAVPADTPKVEVPQGISHKPDKKMNLSYTINLNLPATSDIAVFNAIFKSLREHLLKD